MGIRIEQCEINELTLAHAKTVAPATEGTGSFVEINSSELTDSEKRELLSIDPESEEERARFDRRIRRIRQQQFRDALFAAYESKCAISGFDTPQVLQAAHIDPYRGPQSQYISNGVLLRADLHLLYDANLLSIAPDTHIVKLAN